MYLGCFQFETIRNNAAMNVLVLAFRWTHVTVHYCWAYRYLRVELLGQGYVYMALVHSYILLSKVHVQFTFPPAAYELLASSFTLVIVNLFHYSHSGGCVVASHCGFIMHFPNDSWVWASFTCTDCLDIHFCDIAAQVPCPFSHWIISPFLTHLMEFFINSG